MSDRLTTPKAPEQAKSAPKRGFPRNLSVGFRIVEDAGNPAMKAFVVAVDANKFKADLPWSFGPRPVNTDSGLDVPIPTQVTIQPYTTKRIDMGVFVRAFDLHYGGQAPVATSAAYWMVPRSSIAKPPKSVTDDTGTRTSRGRTLIIPNSPAVIDMDYRGELKLQLFNPSALPVTLPANEAVSQLVFPSLSPFICHVISVGTPEYELYFPPTNRGAGGFGSTGARGQ